MTGCPIHRYLPFLHGLQQRALAFGGSAVDLVSENQLGKDGPRMMGQQGSSVSEGLGVDGRPAGGMLDGPVRSTLAALDARIEPVFRVSDPGHLGFR